MNHLFHKFALRMSRIIGSMWAFFTAVILVVVTAYHFGFTEKWTVESVIVIASFLMLFFLQHSQNVNERATHLKLDELIRALEGARNEVVSIEDRAENEIEELKETIMDANEELKEIETHPNDDKGAGQ
ncbi:MAG: low affinity iron permease family protein [Gammaproteobacteria bacterium]